ncbi:MAG: 50S rRNA methyltransferase [Proteobacteria bacterium]|nr:MAG: 50S rRNA methyltransferase [Pseudomonadota bacterium]
MGSRLRNKKRRHDVFYKRARDARYPARSVYKLKELDERFKLLRSGQRVLDLGCRPGSWLLYAAERVGKRGLVIGIDRQPLEIALPSQARVVIGDIREVPLETLCGGEESRAAGFDTVLSDMAPDTSGVAFTDHVRCLELFDVALELSRTLGRPGGAFVGKLFMGEGFDEMVRKVKSIYKRSKTVKPEATRKESKELYIVAQERKTPPLG